MPTVIWTDQSIADLAGHVAYIDLFNPIAADRMAGRLLTAGNSLATFPKRGRARPDGARELAVVPPYILRNWHGSQDRTQAD